MAAFSFFHWEELDMAGCSIVVLAAAFGGVALAALFSYFGMLALGLVAGIVFLVLSSVVMKIPEVRAKHRVLRVVCIVLGVALVACSLVALITSGMLINAIGSAAGAAG